MGQKAQFFNTDLIFLKLFSKKKKKNLREKKEKQD